jgi:hypothetical protein
MLKGDARLATVLRRAVWSHVVRPTEPLVVPRGVRKWRVPAYVIQEVLDELAARGVRYSAARELLPQRLAHHVLLGMEQAGEAPDDRVQDAVAKSPAVKKYVASVWPDVDAKTVLHRLWSDAEFLRDAAAGDLTDDERALLTWAKPPRSRGGARWTRGDMALLDELADLLSREPSLGHIVLDEAQDLSPMQLRAVEVVPATVAKGLEFDRVVVVEPAAIADAEPDERTGLRRLYVVLTRAVSELTIVHADPLPAALA